MIDELTRWFAPWKNRIMSIARFGTILQTDDTLGIQKCQIETLADVVQDNIERFQNYGFTSNPQPDSECFVVYPGGEQSHGLIVAIDDRRFRIKSLAPGEVAIYTDEGDSIQFKRGNIMNIQTGNLTISATQSITLQAPQVNITAPLVGITASNQILAQTPNLQASGNVSPVNLIASGWVADSTGPIADIRTKYNSHVHFENGVSGQPPTSTPTPTM